MKYLEWFIYIVLSAIILYIPVNWITNTLGIVENRSFVFVIATLILSNAVNRWRNK